MVGEGSMERCLGTGVGRGNLLRTGARRSGYQPYKMLAVPLSNPIPCRAMEEPRLEMNSISPNTPPEY